ncbi:membrane protein [Streptococcus pneumoniae]|nr:membrane protein [Streptococcus pneumoniae]VMJ89571.1 membrane protein [Streptococcus pneumoniae]
MNTRKKTQFMTMTALLTAIAILIPPASYTLGSHIAIFIAMFLSPLMAVFVILASSFGFLMAGYPMVIVFRAFSHIFFGTLGALYLQKFPDTLDKPKSSWIFNFVLAVVHALAEVLACVIFYATSGTNVENMFYVLFVLVGFGTIIHSMVDYTLALAVYKVLRKRR